MRQPAPTARLALLQGWGGGTFLAGVGLATCFSALAALPSLRGPLVVAFLSYFTLAGITYTYAVYRLRRPNLPLAMIWTLAVAFRLALLFSQPTLSDDVYRYLWDGHLLNQAVNPYAFPVESTQLDFLTTPLRALVNHPWMASPYLPIAQMFFGLVGWLAPQNPMGFQISAAILDLVTGWLVMDCLRRLNLPQQWVLIYLWNPLVVVEFAHGAHVDALMIALTMASFWALIRADIGSRKSSWLLASSAVFLAAATLTKALPALLVPLFARRWGWRRLALYAVIVLGSILPFTLGAGWGLTGPLDGTGVFGAIRIFLRWWNFNSGVYHWLEVTLTGYPTAGAVPVEVVGEGPILLARWISTGLLSAATLATGWATWRGAGDKTDLSQSSNQRLLRLAIVPLGAYLLLTPIVHPWYVTIVLPLIPFLLLTPGEVAPWGRFQWPWIYFSLAVAFSYLTYLDPNQLQELDPVRKLEYLPFYALLVWAGWPLLANRRRDGGEPPAPDGDPSGIGGDFTQAHPLGADKPQVIAKPGSQEGEQRG